MTESSEFRVAVEGPDGIRYYVLMSSLRALPDDTRQKVFFFTFDRGKQEAADTVAETLPQELPVDGLVKVVRSLVNLKKFDTEAAVELVANLKLYIEKLSRSEHSPELQRQIRAFMAQEDDV